MQRSGSSRLSQLYWPTLFLGAWALTSGSRLSLWLCLNLAAWPFVLALSVTAHEAGHALMGVALGFAPFRIRLGAGPLLKELRLGPIRVEVRDLPLAGMVMVSTRTLFAMKPRMWLLYAGGPAMTLGLFWLAVSRSGGLHVGSLATGPAPWELLGFVNALLLIVSLYPGHINGMATDGRNLLLIIPWVPVARFESLLITQQLERASAALRNYDFAEARQLSQKAAARLPSSEHVRFLQGAIELLEGNVAEARPIFTQFLEHPEPQLAALSRNNLAWGAFIERKAEALAEALAFSEAAAQMLPHHASVQGTRGAVLFWAGKNDEASQNSHAAFDNSDEPQTKAFSACVLAMLSSRSGNRAEADQWLARAERLDPRCSLLKEARASSRKEDRVERV